MSTLDTFWPHLAGEIGLLGLAAYLWFLWRAGRASWRLASRREAPPHAQVLGTAACVFLIAAALEAFAAPNLEDAFCCFMVFSMLGLTNQHRLR
ncbi:hypothetical protein FJY63_06965 [Candidatus Sumerlaeota bacterium]|nr:hypothetical protein [Candidatus Sumerlaeota bacterium]